MLPYKQAALLTEHAPELKWLVEDLWCEGAVGILGGEPKCCKSFLALELAVAVSSGNPCMGRFQVQSPGPVLLFAAEDAQSIVRNRLAGIAKARNSDLATLDIQVITSEKLRLDHAADVEALNQTVMKVRPRLLILDPFVRLHRIDENSSSEVAPVLENLRMMQRRHTTAILIVHHAKKNGASARAGQALRGSSEFHAWGDSNLYMRRTGDRIMLSMEHRAAPSRGGIPLALKGDDDRLALEIEVDIADDSSAASPPLSASERIEQALVTIREPMSFTLLRQEVGLRTAIFCATIKAMIADGRVCKTEAGYTLTLN